VYRDADYSVCGRPSKQYYRDPSIVVRYGQTIGQVLEALLKQSSDSAGSLQSDVRSWSAALVDEILTFESKLAEATPNTEDFGHPTFYYNAFTMDEARALIPQLSIQYLIYDQAPPDFQPEKLIVGSPSYLKNLSSVLQETSVEALQAYFV